MMSSLRIGCCVSGVTAPVPLILVALHRLADHVTPWSLLRRT